MQVGIAPERRHICRRGILFRSGAGEESEKYEVTNNGAMETYLNANSQTFKNHCLFYF